MLMGRGRTGRAGIGTDVAVTFAPASVRKREMWVSHEATLYKNACNPLVRLADATVGSHRFRSHRVYRAERDSRYLHGFVGKSGGGIVDRAYCVAAERYDRVQYGRLCGVSGC